MSAIRGISAKEYHTLWRAQNKDKVRAAQAAYRASHPGRHKALYEAKKEEILAKQREWQAANPERVKSNGIAWKRANREKVLAYGRAWRKRNLAKDAAKVTKRNALKKRQTCFCCKAEQLVEIYSFARDMHMEVDHRKPLSKGGLHCVNNLQLLTAEENRRKSNKWQEAA